MSNDLWLFIAGYGELEGRVQGRMAVLCADHCRRCSTVCCKIDYCRESWESPFLIEARNRLTPQALRHADGGWLGPRGCTLPVGRPPVCYAFCCNAILDAQFSPMDRYALNLLADLVTFVGRRARGTRHLVEVNDLAAINLPRLEKQLALAEKILEQLVNYWDKGIELDMTASRAVRRYQR